MAHKPPLCIRSILDASAQKLKTQRKNIAGGEKGANRRRLRSFDLIHNFAVFREERRGSLLSARASALSFFFLPQSRENRNGKMWKSCAIHSASGDGDVVHTVSRRATSPAPRQIPSSFARNDSYIVSVAIPQSGIRDQPGPRERALEASETSSLRCLRT